MFKKTCFCGVNFYNDNKYGYSMPACGTDILPQNTRQTAYNAELIFFPLHNNKVVL